jgi:hypothetical protein
MKKSIVVATLLFASAFADNLVQNGSFENFDKDIYKWGYAHLDNWDGLAEVWSNRMGRASVDGTYKIELDTHSGTPDSLTQTITTEEGKKYLFHVDAYARKTGTSDFELLVDGEVILQVSPTKHWQKYGATFTGKGGEQTITIRELTSQDDGYGAILDNVMVRSDITTIDELKMQDFAKREILEPWGLDQVAEIIDNDNDLRKRFSAETLEKAKEAALKMNAILKEAIKNNGLTNDNLITGADAKEIQNYILKNYKDEFRTLREDFYVIEKKGYIKALGRKALRNVWAKIYNLANDPYDRKHVASFTGKKSDNYKTVAFLLDSVINKKELTNPDYKEVTGTTGTALDKIAAVILKDRGLNKYNTTSDLRAGVYYANEMNKLLVKAIVDTAVANDGVISPADVRTLNNYLVKNYAETWAELHGNDEDNEEYGYHLVQNDGATTRMFGENVINTIADGIYHLGYATNHKYHLVNEDGNKNQTFEDIAWWLDISLKEDIKAGKLTNPDYKEVTGTTGTALDKIVPAIFNDEGLLRKVSTDDMRVAARNANRMNELLIEAIKETGVAEDKFFTAEDIKELNKYLVENYAEEWAELHGDDEDNEETGFHRVQNDGAVSRIEASNLINTVADGIYHLGYQTNYKHNLVNEDGNKNVTFYSVAYWLNKYLANELQDGKLVK